mgnify:CR=1 FL=1
MKIKTISAAKETYYELTHEAIIEIDGDVLNIRVHQSSEFTNVFIYVENNWRNIDDIERTDLIEKLFVQAEDGIRDIAVTDGEEFEME